MNKVVVCLKCDNPVVIHEEPAMVFCPHCGMPIPVNDATIELEKLKNSNDDRKKRVVANMLKSSVSLLQTLQKEGDRNSKEYDETNQKIVDILKQAYELEPNNYMVLSLLGSTVLDVFYQKKRKVDYGIIFTNDVEEAKKYLKEARKNCEDDEYKKNIDLTEYICYKNLIGWDIDIYTKKLQNGPLKEKDEPIDGIISEFLWFEGLKLTAEQKKERSELLAMTLKLKKIAQNMEKSFDQADKEEKEEKEAKKKNKNVEHTYVEKHKVSPIWMFVFGKFSIVWGIAINLLILSLGVYTYMVKKDISEGLNYLYIVDIVLGAIVMLPVLLSLIVPKRLVEYEVTRKIPNNNNPTKTAKKEDAHLKESSDISKLSNEEFMGKYYPNFNLKEYVKELGILETIKQKQQDSLKGGNDEESK